MRRIYERAGLILLNIFFIAICFAVLIPILYAVSVSLNGRNSIFGSDFSFIPKTFTLENYRAVIFGQPVLLWLGNTIILAVSSVCISLLAAVPGAYSLSRLRYRGRKTILSGLLMLHSFPAILSMFAIYKLLSPMGLINTKLGLILIYIGTMAIFGLLNLKGYFDSIPIEIEEAARIDGANGRRTIVSVLLPLAKPAIIVTGVMVLIYVWNEYIYAITFMTGESNYTLAAGLYSLQATEMSGSWPIFAAASVVVSLPILIIFFAAQKHMVSGLTAGGVKG
ncbi:MAG: ABC transporter permease subunit [Clostridiales bacterium]|jgi:arabinogalactan oligomer/maltooligosaccharide transport system permease protein|nr:ABC transporter permease subunit [Clostridiales bacterium]